MNRLGLRPIVWRGAISVFGLNVVGANFGSQLLKVVVGYNRNPSLSEILAYPNYYVVLGLSLRLTLKTAPAHRDAA